jgi:ubiquinone/menaquinone biosynthesis C-methylase UbiE
LERVLEPEVMDTAEEAMAYDAMDHAQVNRLFVDDLLAAGPNTANLLDVGTGTALIPIELCQRVDAARVTAVDLSANMLDLARANAEAAGVMPQLQLDLVDAKGLPYADGQFSCAISNSIVHHIPTPLPAIAEAVRVTAPGGLLFFRDLMRPASIAEVEQLVNNYAGGEADHARQMFYDSLRAALELEEMRHYVEQLGFSAASVAATSDRHWTWSAVKS